MADIFRFDELTWPEVVALPRETPLLLPLGSVPGLETVPAFLKATQPVSLLPTIPFGWARSATICSMLHTCCSFLALPS